VGLLELVESIGLPVFIVEMMGAMVPRR